MADKPETEVATQNTPVSLAPSTHKGLKVRQTGNIEHIAKNHIAKVYSPEYTKAGLEYPIVFIKDPETQEFFSVVIWGMEPGENLFMKEGKWTGGFLPVSVRCYPFTVALSPEDPDRLFIGLFENSPMLNKEEGELIFNEDGSETEWMANIKEFLVRVYDQEQLTKTLAKKLDTLGLLVPQSLSIQIPKDSPEKTIDGFYIVDREKLAALSEKDYLELRSQNALEVIYAHLMSLDTLGRLMTKKTADNQDASNT